jgi:hypothetical protein
MACRPEIESRGARSHGAGRRWPGRILAVPATRCSGEGLGSKVVEWWTSFGVAGRMKLTGRMSSMRCGRLERNSGGGNVQGWWSAARGAGRSYTTARCSGCGRGDRRGAGARCLWWLSDGEQGGTGVVKVTELEKVSPGGCFIAARGGGRGGGNGGR